MTQQLIDIHQHVIFDTDDGPRSLAETEAMLDSASRQGIHRIFATPHVWPGKQFFDYDAYLDKLNDLNVLMWQKESPLRLVPGAEIYYTPQALPQLIACEIPTMALGRHVLIEFSPAVKQEDLLRAMRELVNNGYLPILAHVERYQCLHRDWSAIEDLRMMDVLIQMNAQTVLNSNALVGRQFIRRLLEKNIVDFVATDAHNTSSRPVCLAQAHAFLEKHYGTEMADRLTWQNQRMLLPPTGLTF